MRRSRRAMPAMVAGTLALTGCASGSGGDDAAARSTTTTTVAVTSTTEVSTTTTSTMAADVELVEGDLTLLDSVYVPALDVTFDMMSVQNPFEQFVGKSYVVPEVEAILSGYEDNVVIEESIAACMAEFGFEYTPAVGPPPDVEWLTVQDEATVAQVFGFGVTTDGSLAALAGLQPDHPFRPAAPTDDPALALRSENSAYADALSDDDYERYSAALRGPSPGSSIEGVDEDFEGCQLEATSIVIADVPLADQFAAQFVPGFAPETTARQTREDPRFVAAAQAVEACVVDQGYVYVPWYEVETANQIWQSQLDDIADQHVRALTAQEVAALSPEQLAELPDPPVLVDDEGKAKLATLQQEEIATALANRECEEQFRSSDVFLRMYFERQIRYLESIAADVAPWRGVAGED